MRRTYLATFAAAALLAGGLPAGVLAGGGASTAGDTGQSPSTSVGGGTSAGAPGAIVSPSPDMSTSGAPTTSGAAGTSTSGTTSGTAEVSSEKLQSYIQARQKLEQEDPTFKSALESGDLSQHRDKLESMLSGTGMTADEFTQMHQQVQTDPTLRAQVESQMGTAPSTSGAAGAGPTASPEGAPGTTGAAPAASPQ